MRTESETENEMRIAIIHGSDVLPQDLNVIKNQWTD